MRGFFIMESPDTMMKESFYVQFEETAKKWTTFIFFCKSVALAQRATKGIGGGKMRVVDNDGRVYSTRENENAEWIPA